MGAAPPRRIQIVMVEPNQFAQIAAAFHNFDLKYNRRADELDLPAVRPADIREFLEQLWKTDDMTLTKAFVSHVKQLH